jgi:outer membrane protein OmpA-like peptidoglycan-associated protein
VRASHHTAVAGALTLAAGFLLLAPVAAFSQSSSALAFGAEPLTFSQSALAFTSAPIQTETAATIEVTLPADVLFDFDKAEIRATAQRALHEVADIIRARAGTPVTIQGYTDALGKDAYNQALSERRATAVKTWLGTKEGLAVSRFATAGYGPRNPVAPNQKPDGSDDPDGRQLNRRVTLIIRK